MTAATVGGSFCAWAPPCCQGCSHAMATTARTMAAGKASRMRNIAARPSKASTETDAEELGLVLVLLEEGMGQVDGDRAERREPGEAAPGGCADRAAVEYVFAAHVRIGQAAGLDERSAENAQLLRQSQGEALLERAGVQELAAQGIPGLGVARADAGELEAPERGAAQEEAVEQADVLAETDDVAGAPGDVQHPVGREGIVVRSAALDPGELRVGAEIRDILVQRQNVALRWQEARVARVVGQGLAQKDRQRTGFLVLDELGGVVSDVLDLVLAPGQAHAVAPAFGQGIVGAQGAAGRALVERALALEVGAAPEQIDAGRELAVEEVRLGEAEIDLLRARRDGEVGLDRLAAAEEIALDQPNVAERPVRGGETGAERQLAGRPLRDLDFDAGLVGARSRQGVEFDALEETEVLDALARA